MTQKPALSVFPILVMIAAPAFFSTNLIFGRYVAPVTDPFILAFIRWAAVALILLPLAIKSAGADFWPSIKANWWFFTILGVLGMGVSGSGVYLGLQSTTATNATLIYSISPILIILLEWLFGGRKSSVREMVGIAIAFGGAAIIILRADINALISLSFNPGDLLIALGALCWAGYSILYRSDRFKRLSSLSLFGIIALFGALVNFPPALAAWMVDAPLPPTREAWFAVAGIVTISSLLAFSAFQFGVRRLGASIAGMFMYLMTPYGVVLAVVFLGERLQIFHYLGILLVMSGIMLATMPKTAVARLLPKSLKDREPLQ